MEVGVILRAGFQLDQELLNSLYGWNDDIAQYFFDFITSVIKFEALIDVGRRFLDEFSQELARIEPGTNIRVPVLQPETYQKPSFHHISNVADDIIKDNYTDRMKAYMEAGCRHVDHDIDNLWKLHSSKHGLQDNIAKEKEFLDELEYLMEAAFGAIQKAEEDDHLVGSSHDCIAHAALSPEEEERRTTRLFVQHAQILLVTYMMAVYDMLKLDYSMQEKIVLSLGPETSSPELQSYCLMWDLRPYIDDGIMRMLWKLVSLDKTKLIC